MLKSTAIRAIPAAVAKTERIQKLSWQKLQYWMIAIMMALHRNMVTYGHRKGGVRAGIRATLPKAVHHTVF